MKRANILLLLVAFVAMHCQDDEQTITADVTGQWKGKTATFKVNPEGIIPAFTLNEIALPITLDFQQDGKLNLTDSKDSVHVGTYSRTDNRINMSIPFKFEMIELSGEYEIEELTDTTLVVSTSRQGSYTHPDTGQKFDGKVEATFNFEKLVSLQ